MSMKTDNQPTERAMANGRRVYELMKSRYGRDSDVSRFAKVKESAGTGPYGDFSARRAKAVDLVSLPVVIEGTNCGNCTSFVPSGDAMFVAGSDGYCKNPKVRMHVADSYCCNEWSRADAPLAKPPKQAASQAASHFRRRSRVSRHAISDWSKADKLSDRQVNSLHQIYNRGGSPNEREMAARALKSHGIDPEDCGHEPSGEFSYQNTCANHSSGFGSEHDQYDIDDMINLFGPDRLEDTLGRAEHDPDLALNLHGELIDHYDDIGIDDETKDRILDELENILAYRRREKSGFRRSRGINKGKKGNTSRYTRADVRSHVRNGSYIHAGDKDDCGHEEAGNPEGGNFTTGNSCRTYRETKREAHAGRLLNIPAGKPKDPHLRKKLANEKRAGLGEWREGRHERRGERESHESHPEPRRHPNPEARERRLEKLPGGKDPELRKRLAGYREKRAAERRGDLEERRTKRETGHKALAAGKSASREARLLERLLGGGKKKSRAPEEDHDTRRAREQETQRQAAEAERIKIKQEREARKGPYGRARHRLSRQTHRYAKAGDPDDCGHRTVTGHFAPGNTCQSQGRQAALAEPVRRPAAQPVPQARRATGKPEWVKSGGRWVPVSRGPKVSQSDEEWYAQQLREGQSGKSASRAAQPSVQPETAGKPPKKNGHRQELGRDIRGSRQRGELYNQDPGFDKKLRKRLGQIDADLEYARESGKLGKRGLAKLEGERQEIIDTLRHARSSGSWGSSRGGSQQESAPSHVDSGREAAVGEGQREEEPHPSGFSREERREILDRALDRLKKGREKTAGRMRQARSESQARRHPEKYAKPGDVVDMNTSSIHVDPERFQFKGGHAAGTGSVGSLAGAAAFNPKLAGAITVWRDPANGKVYVINGHNRLDLAKRMGTSKIRTEFIDAKDEREARASGAITNIAEGRGTSIDAAKFFRDTEMTKDDAKSLGITMREKIASEGLDLAALDKGLFDKVVQGGMTTARGAIIGGSGLSRVQQRTIYEQLKKLGRRGDVNDRTLRELMDNARHAGSVHKEERDLFGTTTQEQSLAIYRSQVQGDIKDALLKDKNLFKLVSRSKSAQALAERGRSHIDVEETGRVGQEASELLGVFDGLKNRSGPVASALNRAAERISRGESRSTVVKEARSDIVRAIEGLFGGSEAEVA